MSEFHPVEQRPVVLQFAGSFFSRFGFLLIDILGVAIGILCATTLSFTISVMHYIPNSSYKVVVIFLLFILLSNLVTKILTSFERYI